MVEPEQLESFIGVMTGDRGGREDLDRLVKGTWGRSNSSRDRIRREERMKMNRSADFLDFLSTLCVCEGGPIPNNQDTICENLLLKTPDYFLSSRVEGGKVFRIILFVFCLFYFLSLSFLSFFLFLPGSHSNQRWRRNVF